MKRETKHKNTSYTYICIYTIYIYSIEIGNQNQHDSTKNWDHKQNITKFRLKTGKNEILFKKQTRREWNETKWNEKNYR